MAPLASPLNTVQVGRAVEALLQHKRKGKEGSKAQLLEQEDPIMVQFGMKVLPETKRVKPFIM